MVKNNTRSLENAAADAVKVISEAAKNATAAIAQAAESAAKVVANNAEVQAKIAAIPTPASMDDHNLLMRLDQKVDNIQTTVNKLTDRDVNYITKDEHKTLLETVADHETRIKSLETITTKIWSFGLAGIFVVALIEFALRFIIK